MSLTFERYLAASVPTPPAPGRGLNVGCGHDVRAGYVNQDVADLPGVDVVCELGEEKLPFEDGAFDVILARDVLEHVDLIPALRELHRVLAPGGRLVISTVHFTSKNLWVDPTHRRGFSLRTLDMFVGSGTRAYYFDFSFEAIEHVKLQSTNDGGLGRWLFWHRAAEPLINTSRQVQDAYEATFLARLIPGANVLAVLRR
jgi:predicted SAM-dependent methyltransferase